MWPLIIKITHIIGTVLGVGGSTLAEVFLLQSARAGKLNEQAMGLVRGTYQVIRVGTILLVLSGFGYFLLYRLEGDTDRLYSERFWLKMVLVVVIALNSLLFQQHKISTLWGSAIFFTSWYAALILGAWRGLDAAWWVLVLSYLVGLLVVAGIFTILRKRYHAPL
ncbi:MAG: hypothetical protein ACD_41C00299G0012 [uncultured bacterium]|nr:MAG: hypothetical protein ACD_41C00299G0012 [uncultured bacterium]HBY74273.1 hypothetical protein [Candidatus Kerfeldbacteria bacterium]